MKTLWGREPVMFLGTAHAVIALAIAFGVEITQVQFGALEATIAAVLALVTRSQVSPTKTEE